MRVRHWPVSTHVPARPCRAMVCAVISPLLANAYLHELDVEMREAGLVMVRYADNAVVLCRNREEAEVALARLRSCVSVTGLTLHPDKTHVGDCRLEGQGCET